MQNDISVFIMTGTLYSDPEVVQPKHEDGKPFTTCLLKVLKNKFNPETKQWEEGGDFDVVKFSAFNHLGNSLAKYAKEGLFMTVTGKVTGRMSYSEQYGESNWTSVTAIKCQYEKPAQPDTRSQEEKNEDEMAVKQQSLEQQPDGVDLTPSTEPATKTAEAEAEEWDSDDPFNSTPVDPNDMPV